MENPDPYQNLGLWLGVMQIDEIDIVVIVIRGGDGPNRKKTSPAAKTSEGFLLMFNVADEIGTLVRGVDLVTTTEEVTIQFRHDHIFGRLCGQIIIQQQRIRGCFDSPDIAVAR